MNTRRRLLASLFSFGAGLVAARAAHAEPDSTGSTRFPGDPTDHNVVFQFNKSDEAYHQAVLFAVGEMVRKYGDNITIVVVAFGPGIHILAKKPLRPVSDTVQERVKSLAEYGVKFHACGNTMKSMGWTEADMLPFAEMVMVGAADIMELQEQGYSYLSW